MMTRIATAAAMASAVFSVLAVAQQRAPVLVELFTSEGCSSCPPADTLLARLERDQPVTGAEVIALGEHVDYWDHDGWRDRFSSALFTARQQDYGQALKLQSVYTPQMVINGQEQVLGSDWDAANRAIRAAVAAPKALVTLKPSGWDEISCSVRALPKGTESADMFLAVTESNVETSVMGGENNGRRLRHAGVVRSMIKLGKLDTKKDGAYTGQARLNLRPEWNRQNLRVVLFVQDHTSRKIIGAAAARL